MDIVRRLTISLCLIATAGLLLVACENPAPQPSPPIPPQPVQPGPSIQRSTGPIAFVSDRDGTPAIYLANEDGSDATRLTAGQAPAWSRDGRTLAFSWGGIHVINVDGSGLRRLTGWGSEPAWSPDGRTIVFQDISVDLIEADGTNRRRIFDKIQFSYVDLAWSPDGRQIAFAAWDYGFCACGLWLMGADGSNPRQVADGNLWPGGEAPWSPAWSPDGGEIAALWEHRGIGVVSADGTQRRLLNAGKSGVRNVDWTADGRLVFARSTSFYSTQGSRIFVSDGGSDRQLIPDATSPAKPDYGDWDVAWRR